MNAPTVFDGDPPPPRWGDGVVLIVLAALALALFFALSAHA